MNAERKYLVQSALAAGIRARGLLCYMLPDGMTVRVDDMTAYEPDALIYCGAKLDRSAVEVPNPVIVLEVLSPSSRRADATIKLAGYFRLPSVAHFLIVDADQPLIVHHGRAGGDAILTHIVRDGRTELDPPGLKLALIDIYGA